MKTLFYSNHNNFNTSALSFLNLEGKTLCIEDANNYLGPLIIIIPIWFEEDIKILYQNRKEKKLKTKIIVDHSYEEIGGESEVIIHNLSSFVSNPADILLIYLYSTDLRAPDLKYPCPAIPVNGCALNTYHLCFNSPDQKIDTTLVKDRTNALNVLISKIGTRDVRFAITYYLYKHDLLRNAVTGIIAKPDDFKMMMNRHPEYYDIDFYNTIINYLGPADHTRICEIQNIADNGFPFNPDIFKRSSVSLVSETFDVYYDSDGNSRCTEPYLITEKFYRTIANRHPFVIQGSSGMVDTIRQYGYQTFSDIIDENYTYYSTCNLSHVESSVLAAKELILKLPNHIDRIQEIVDFNFKQFKILTEKELTAFTAQIENFCNS